MKDALKRGIMLKPSIYQHDDLPGTCLKLFYPYLQSKYENICASDVLIKYVDDQKIQF